MALRLLHFADLHLDRSFAGERLFGAGAQRRREDLRDALTRIVQRARDASVDLITCGGDLFEHDQVTKDTGNFAAQTLGEAGRPVLIAPGHADPALPGSPYRYMRWPANVTIAAHEELRPYRFGAVDLWTAGFMRPGVTEAPLRNFNRLEQGINLLLLHGSDMTQVPAGTAPFRPLTPDQVRDAGFHHALLGHYHDGRSADGITYPGSPETLSWDEQGRHATALVTIADDGTTEVQLEDIAEHPMRRDTIDVSRMTSRDHVRDAAVALRERQGLRGAITRVFLDGERSPGLVLDPKALNAECGEGFAYLEFQDRTRVSHDLDGAAQEFTSRGEMVRKLLERQPEAAAEREAVGRALQLALDAFEQ
ncbi:MAG: metallophosphoesterase [Candidatus Dormibacteraeota bacterium]|nr:metallophosphoesterase [Candidatus Dormibacteraeota bacterium]